MNSDKEIADVARKYVEAVNGFDNISDFSDEYYEQYALCEKYWDILKMLVEKEGK